MEYFTRFLLAHALLLFLMTMPSLVQSLGSPSPKIRRFQPDELRAAVKETLTSDTASASPLWSVVLPRRLASVAAEEGCWLADDGFRCIAQVVEPAQINVFHRVADTEEQDEHQESIQSVLQAAVQLLQKERQDGLPSKLVLKFSALDRKIYPRVRTILTEGRDMQHKFSSIYTAKCGMWVYEGTKTQHQSIATFNKDLPEGISIRRLRQDNAELVDQRWEYRSDTSLGMIRRMIQLSEEEFGGCVGLFVGERLVSWVCRYLDSTLGMLFTESDHRKNGYAALVVMAAVSDCCQRGAESDIGSGANMAMDGRAVSYIVDSNDASQSLYRKLGWERVAEADWVGFACGKRQ